MNNKYRTYCIYLKKKIQPSIDGRRLLGPLCLSQPPRFQQGRRVSSRERSLSGVCLQPCSGVGGGNHQGCCRSPGRVAVSGHYHWEKLSEPCSEVCLERRGTQQPELQGTERTDLSPPELPLGVPPGQGQWEARALSLWRAESRDGECGAAGPLGVPAPCVTLGPSLGFLLTPWVAPFMCPPQCTRASRVWEPGPIGSIWGEPCVPPLPPRSLRAPLPLTS